MVGTRTDCYRLWLNHKEKIASLHRIEGYKEMEFYDESFFYRFLLQLVDDWYKVE